MRKNLLFLSILLVSIFAIGCSSDGSGKGADDQTKEVSDNFNETGFPIVDEPIEITMVGQKVPNQAEFNDMSSMKEYEKSTNIKVDFQTVPFNGWEEKKNILLSGGDVPDAFFKSQLSNADIVNYGGQGVLIPLNDLIEEYAPNVQAMFEEFPEVKRTLTAPDGNIYTLPQISNYLANRIYQGWINKAWLDELGLDVPETTDEYFEALKAFRDEDPNGNGKADEIGFSSGSPTNIRKMFNGSFGVATAGANSNNFDLDKDGNVRFYPIADGYKDMLEYINKLYKEDLIDPEYFMGTAEWEANGEKGVVGTFMAGNSLSIGSYVDDYVAVGALEGPNGDKAYNQFNPTVQQIGTFAITHKNEYPAETMRWIDHFYGEEGARLIRLGVEGITYEETEDGELEYIEGVEVNDHIMYGGGSQPYIVFEEHVLSLKRHPLPVEEAEAMKEYLPEDPWPPFLFTSEEQDKIDGIQTDLDTFVDEMAVKFIVGDKPFSEWDDYVSIIEKMGVEDYLEVVEAAYERYINSN